MYLLRKRELIIVPSGGLANRMRAIASGIQLAKDYNYRPKIIWVNNWEVGIKYSDLFAKSSISKYVKEVDALTYSLIYEIPRKKNLYISLLFQNLLFNKSIFDEKQLLSMDDKKTEILQLIQTSNKVLIRSGLEYYNFDLKDYCNYFQASGLVNSLLCCIIKNFNTSVYGFHIRRTDNIESIKHSPIDLFIEEADKLLSIDENKIFLASDSEDVKVIFKEKYKDRVIITPYAAARDTKDGMIWAFAEMIALSKTKAIYGSYYSSYSEAAAKLGNVKLIQLKI